MADRLSYLFLGGLAPADLSAIQAGSFSFGGVSPMAILTAGHTFVPFTVPHQAQPFHTLVASQGPFAPGTQPHFELGSSSTAASSAIFTRAQRRNFRRREARRTRRGHKTTESRSRVAAGLPPTERPAEAIDLTYRDEECLPTDRHTMPSFSHLRSSSRFHLLAATIGEESLTRVARTAAPSSAPTSARPSGRDL